MNRKQNLGAENEDPSGFGLSNKALLAISLQHDRVTPYGRWTPLRGGSYHSDIQQRQRLGTTNNNSITLSISFVWFCFSYTYNYRYSPRLYGLSLGGSCVGAWDELIPEAPCVIPMSVGADPEPSADVRLILTYWLTRLHQEHIIICLLHETQRQNQRTNEPSIIFYVKPKAYQSLSSSLRDYRAVLGYSMHAPRQASRQAGRQAGRGVRLQVYCIFCLLVAKMKKKKKKRKRKKDVRGSHARHKW